MIAVITNMMSYSKLKVAEIVQVEKKNESDARSSYRADILKNRLIEAFSEKAELSHLYNPDNPVFHNLTTPQGKAFDWMLRFDKYKHPKSTQQYNDQTENPTVVQRYILAVLFFATEGEYNNYLGSKFTPEDNRAGTWTNYGLLRFLSSNLHECSWWTKNMHGSLKGVKACDSLGLSRFGFGFRVRVRARGHNPNPMVIKHKKQEHEFWAASKMVLVHH